MVPSFCDCSRRATVGETSVYSAASRSRRLPGDIRHLRKIAHTAVHPAVDLLGAEGRLTKHFQLGPQLRQRHGFDVFQGFLLNLQIKKPSVSRCPGSSVTIAPGAMPEPSGHGAFSGTKSGCVRRKSSATASFSRRRIVQVL